MWRIPAVLLAVVVTGCAPLALTPEQSRVYDQVDACSVPGASARVVEVQADGQRFTLRGRHTDLLLVRRCLAERFGYRQWDDPRIVEQPVEPGGG